MDISARRRACSFVGWFDWAGEDGGEACYNVGEEGGVGDWVLLRTDGVPKIASPRNSQPPTRMSGTCQRCLADMNSEMKSFFVSPDLRIERRGIY
jgi:hypothetical protein